MELIDKAAVVAEIERRIKTNKECMLGLKNLDYYQGKVDALNDTISFLDTIEMKEVDLDYIKDELDRVVKIYKPDGDFGWGTLYNIATHFYELGLRCKSSYVSIPNIDDTLEEMGVDPDSKSAKIFKEFYYMALEKFKAQKGEKV